MFLRKIGKKIIVVKNNNARYIEPSSITFSLDLFGVDAFVSRMVWVLGFTLAFGAREASLGSIL
jgi:hypothetical protein